MSEYVYAVMDGGNNVVNVIIGDSADAASALRLLIPDAAEIVLTDDHTGSAYIGGDMLDGRFRMPSPYPSWLWNSEAWAWEAPLPYPEGGNGYVWDEGTTSWVEMPLAPEPEPAREE